MSTASELFDQARLYLKERGYSEEEIFEECALSFPQRYFVIDVVGIPIAQDNVTGNRQTA